jgi:hypothetical protein
LAEGQCYAADQQGPALRHVDCGEAKAAQVVKRIDGSADTTACPESSRAVAYPAPKRTYCIAKPENG